MNAKIYQKKTMIVFFLIPAFLFIAVFLFYPFIQNIINSFQHIKHLGTMGGEWNDPWYKNYLKMLDDQKIKIALQNTGIMVLATLIGQVGIALILTLLVSNIKKGSGFFRVVFFFPIVVSATALGLLFNLIFLYSDAGMINSVRLAFGAEKTLDFKSVAPMITMMTPVIWQYVGFYFIIMLTGVSGIPEDLYEAASIDGASRWQSVRYITLPLLRNSICTCVVLAVTGALKVFDLPWTMFPKGMSNTWLTGTYMYSKTTSDVDYAAAISILIVIVGVVLSVLVNNIFKQNSDYDV